MNETEFEDLTVKVLLNEANTEEKAAFRSYLERNPHRRAEFEELLAVKMFIREIAEPSQNELSAVPVPERHLRELKEAIHREFAGCTSLKGRDNTWLQIIQKNWLKAAHLCALRFRLATAALAAFALIAGMWFFLSSMEDKKVTWVRSPKPPNRPEPLKKSVSKTTADVQALLALPAKQFLTINLLTPTRSIEAICIYSPREATAYLNPPIIWSAELGKTYEISITNLFEAGFTPLEAKGVTPPLEFEKVPAWQWRKLTTNTLYQLTVTETGNTFSTTVIKFRTLTNADSVRPQTNKLEHAREILISRSPQLGDVLADLMSLPENLALSEEALKLKRYIFGKLECRAEYEAVTAELQRLVEQRTR